MARKGIFERIADVFRKKRGQPIPAPPPLSEAWKDLPDDHSPEESRGAAILSQTEDEFTDFMTGGWLVVTSSNVQQMRFLPDPGELQTWLRRGEKGKSKRVLDFGRGDRFRLNGHLEIKFHDGTYYRYDDIEPDLAEDFYTAASKGKAVWDYLRVRGTVTGHQKPYVFLSGPSKINRKWNKNSETAAEWGRRGDEVNKRLGINLGKKRKRRK